MTVLLQFTGVTCNQITCLSFSLATGEIAVLKTASRGAKTVTLELALGEQVPTEGSVLLHGKPLEAVAPDAIGWVAANGGLIGNLKIWENITLPLWYHGKRVPAATEEAVKRWLTTLELDMHEWSDFMASPPARLKPWERKLAGLLRGLVQAPQLLVVDAELFDDIEQESCSSWVAALEVFVREAEDRAVLVVSDGATLLPWRIIE